ncbi:DUF3470 domain-containing protein, partial [Francisella tularensis subsp. holarctica]
SDNVEQMLDLNRDLAGIWPNIVEKCVPCEDAVNWASVPDKLKYLVK